MRFAFDDKWGDAESLVTRLADRGVLAGSGGPNALRMVTHADVNDIDVERALRAFGEIAKGH